MRTLVIRLGEAFATLQDELDDHAARASRPSLRTLGAPVAAVGNLSRPVQILREQLESELRSSLTDLLALRPDNPEPFFVDVFVLLNLGEPLVANAASVIIDLFTRIVNEDFATVFPSNRTGSDRRVRVIPVAMLPAAADCEKDRTAAMAELDAVHDAFVERRDAADTSWLVDRIFLLDAMTSRGIARLDDLVDQIAAFIRLMVLGGVRRSPDVVRMLEAQHADLFASFGVASCVVDLDGLRSELARRLSRDVASAMGRAKGRRGHVDGEPR